MNPELRSPLEMRFNRSARARRALLTGWLSLLVAAAPALGVEIVKNYSTPTAAGYTVRNTSAAMSSYSLEALSNAPQWHRRS